MARTTAGSRTEAKVVGQCLGVEARPVAAEVVLLRRSADQLFGERLGLGEEEPVPVDQAELLVHASPHFGGWDDVQHRKAVDAVGRVQGKPVGATAASVVAGQEEPFETEIGHDVDEHSRHLALRARRRWSAPPVAGQIGRDDGEILCQGLGDCVPHRVGLWMAVQEQQRPTLAAHPES